MYLQVKLSNFSKKKFWNLPSETHHPQSFFSIFQDKKFFQDKKSIGK